MSKLRHQCKTLEEYREAVLKLLIEEYNVDSAEAKQLIALDEHYLAEMFAEGGLVEEAAKEVSPNEDEVQDVIVEENQMISISGKTLDYLKSIHETGLFGDRIEDVAVHIINQGIVRLIGDGIIDKIKA